MTRPSHLIHPITSKISNRSAHSATHHPSHEVSYKLEWPNSITPRSSTDSIHPTVPPTTPNARFSFIHAISPIPTPFPKVENLQLPYIRQVGIKTAIDILSQYFSCIDYKLNPLQFWFLDVITDCLWKMQDEFQFPEAYQKTIMEWLLYVFDLVRDPHRNLTRKEFFQVFNEALTVAGEKVQAGCDQLPTPKELFTWNREEDDERISFTESDMGSSIIVSSRTNRESFVAVGIDEESVEVFALPKIKQQFCPDEFLTDTSATTAVLEEESLCGCEEASIELYEPDPNTPERFISSSSSSSAISAGQETTSPSEPKFLWKHSSFPSNTITNVCSEETMLTSVKSVESNENVVEEWKKYVTDRSEKIREMEKTMMINNCALFAIKQFVYDYFYETFQYTIIKLSLITKFTSITEAINTQWNIPKVLKEELKKPKEKKAKKPKKAKKAKKPKSPRKKTKSKKDKKKKSKKDSKKGKKPKKEKKKKLTKEEKAELARLKREQERLEEEFRKAEENRRLLFPLKEATDDEFFKSIFTNWVKPKEKKQKGKKKK